MKLSRLLLPVLLLFSGPLAGDPNPAPGDESAPPALPTLPPQQPAVPENTSESDSNSPSARERPADGSAGRPQPAMPSSAIARQYPPPFFLTPLAATPAHLGLATPREMVFLYTAPLLDRDRIAAAAAEQEQYTRSTLAARQSDLARRLCALPAPAGREALARLREEQQRQLALWRRTLARFETMQNDRIETIAPAFSRSELKKLHRTVLRLQTERQELVAAAWEEFFEELADDLGDCAEPRKYTELPDEGLHQPVFLARYYFFRKLPPRLRVKFTP